MDRRNFLTVLAIAGTTVSATQTLAADALIAGTYSVQGRNTDGHPYQGFAHVMQDGSSVNIQWAIGEEIVIGNGAIDGKIVTVEWNAEFPVVYVVAVDGELHGTWADGLALDKLTPQ
ncbi:hypothetical protein [uncultured Ruegeria sp.]|uniref:hypothetical protein n=1 Tax=uncultured Ruegeria sp. TaxID=259304 RepID=UPI002610E3A0|nr:hypothetical protein [uncultured Ruegeria sp.]